MSRQGKLRLSTEVIREGEVSLNWSLWSFDGTLRSFGMIASGPASELPEMIAEARKRAFTVPTIQVV